MHNVYLKEKNSYFYPEFRNLKNVLERSAITVEIAKF